MKQFCLALLLLLLCHFSFAQKDFRSGYIIQNGDTLKGLLDYRGAVRSSQVATFKQNVSGPEKTFTPHDIQAYGFANEQKQYESFDVSTATAGDPIKERLFLNTLIRGKASIYYYRDLFHKEHYFLMKEHAPLVELVHREYIRKDPKTGKNFKAVDKAYAQTLAIAFSDCDKINANRLENLKFTASALAGLAEMYNECFGDTGIQKARTKKPTFTFAPAAFYTLTSLKLSGDHSLSKGDYKDESIGFGGGITTNTTIPIANEKLSVQVDMLYMPVKQTAFFSYTDGLGWKYDYDVLFDIDYLKLPVQLKYTYPKGRIKPYVSTGLANSYAVQVTQQVTKTSAFQSREGKTEVQPALGEGGYRRYYFGFIAGTGLLVPVGSKALSLEARYEANNNFSRIMSLTARANHLYFMLSYPL